jgi:2-polyprenyl-3-methyl-5-hydroxy-6-metoxy-1,4-benzoquinol methylase
MMASLRHEIALLFPGHWNRNYVSSKLRTDPLYSALIKNLRPSELPLLDLGCGLGLLAFVLRAEGILIPIQGLDYDPRKIAAAREAATKAGWIKLSFDHADLRDGLPAHLGNVSILDILQFFTASEQEKLIVRAAESVAAGGKLIIRSGLCDRSWRFKVTVLGDLVARLTRWMKAAPTHYPSRADFERMLTPLGVVTITPLWGNTPFNNYLIVLEKNQ